MTGDHKIRGGWLDDLEDLEKQTRNAQRLMDTESGTADGADGLIEATVTARGELTELVLDPRVLRDLDSATLAAEVRTAVNDARVAAQDAVLLAFAAELPSLDADDPAFGPFLAELARAQGRAVR
ncbi:YbaB/EbfC family nucleoid-associated protein [Kribbella sp. NPDC026611]|uniref:YbaB/EbfC family nucleoid-associated protein n=1 Tax=Kribbella sp. NPDC026611 TaxID=3154911 RepID=UPI0033FEF3F1